MSDTIIAFIFLFVALLFSYSAFEAASALSFALQGVVAILFYLLALATLKV